MTQNPYESLPPQAFWRSAVAEQDALDIRGLWSPKFDITEKTPIVTAGSCFAQHIGRALRERDYNWIDGEAAPGSADLQKAFHYGTFSFRTGNIYTTRMLAQWVEWAIKPEDCPDMFWEKDGRFYDPFRPAVEPDGFFSIEEARASRLATLNAIRSSIRKAEVFVFTLGLTECWRDKATGTEFAICPGTVAGEFDPQAHEFHNMSYDDVIRDLNRAIINMRRIRSGLKVLLTVSPVPLTATASEQHVLNATSYSKSVLRAVAGNASSNMEGVDYFPSYEIITHPVFAGQFYAANQRSVLPEGVDHVMTCFFHDLNAAFGRAAPVPPAKAVPTGSMAKDDGEISATDDVRCEEEMLAAFQSQASAEGET